MDLLLYRLPSAMLATIIAFCLPDMTTIRFWIGYCALFLFSLVMYMNGLNDGRKNNK